MADADPNRETELKLAARPEDLPALRSAPALGAASRAATSALESVYYDTPDQRLARQLVSLRVRRKGKRFVQTLKGPPFAGGGLGRAEWECPVPGPALDLSLFTEPDARALLDSVGMEELQPMFTTAVQRTVRVLEGGGSVIEVAFDNGEIRTPAGAVLPLCEVELELKQGESKALFDLALELAKTAPLRLESRTKAARGFALAAGAVDESVKAEKIALSPEVTVEGALCRIVSNCLAHLAANEACSLKGDDPEGIHQMRVALRRLRSALALFRPYVPAEQYDWLVGEVKWLGGHLGPARDWDVFLTDLLEPVRKGLERTNVQEAPLFSGIDALESAARARRDAAYQGAREAILSPRYTAFMLRLGAWLEDQGWRAQPVSEESARLLQPVITLADELLTKRRKRARKDGQGFAELSVEDRHQLRIALKKLRYAAEFFRSLYEDKAARRYIQRLAAFQDALGHLNDVATATRLLHDLHADGSRAGTGERRAAGLVIGWLARGVADLEAHLNEQWDGFDRAKPFWSRARAE
ncbi:MAG TPA: CHAD domain-containing protein [Azospirillum sp.]|nr:CHAD domain-containing protein [Azospirillum sp.]